MSSPDSVSGEREFTTDWISAAVFFSVLYQCRLSALTGGIRLLISSRFPSGIFSELSRSDRAHEFHLLRQPDSRLVHHCVSTLRDGLRVDSFSPVSERELASWGLNWLCATAFRKPHSLRHRNRLILQVGNRGNQCSTTIWLSNNQSHAYLIRQHVHS